MKRCEVCGDWLVYASHDCAAILQQKEESEASYRLYVAERDARRLEEKKSRRRWAITLSIVMVWVVAGIALTNLAGQDDDGGDEQVASSSSAAEYDYSPPTSELGSPSADSSSPAYADLLERLHAEAAATGYSGMVGQRMSPSIFEGFVGGMLSVCRDVEYGYTTWAEETSRDISTGAPRSAANRFNTFLAHEFCAEALEYN